MIFRARKDWRNSFHWITITLSNVGSTEPPEFNEDSLCIPKHQKRVLSKQKGPDANRGQDLTSRQGALRTLKPSSPSEEPDNKILRGYCGAEGFGKPGPFHIKPKAHAEKEETSENE